MHEEYATTDPQPRMAAFRSDLFDEIEVLKTEIENANIKNTLLSGIAIALFVVCVAFAAILYFSGAAF